MARGLAQPPSALDHFTGLVRGLLCRNCNSRVDWCVHVSGCPWADYLNNPPAAHLQLIVPNRRLSAGERDRIDYLGFNPFPPRGARCVDQCWFGDRFIRKVAIWVGVDLCRLMSDIVQSTSTTSQISLFSALGWR